MFSAKDIIVDAYDRTGIFPNATDGLPGEFLTMGLNLLKGLVSQYNIRNYLTFTQQKVNVNGASSVTIGTDDVSRAITNDVSAPNLVTIQNVFWRMGNETGSEVYTEMKFIPFVEFERYSIGMPVYTWRQINDLQYMMSFKQGYWGKPMVVHYNEKVVVALNTEYALSDEYQELWTLGLSDKLLTYYPRKDDSMKSYISAELSSAISNITVKNAANRLIMANKYDRMNNNIDYFNSGAWLYGG